MPRSPHELVPQDDQDDGNEGNAWPVLIPECLHVQLLRPPVKLLRLYARGGGSVSVHYTFYIRKSTLQSILQSISSVYILCLYSSVYTSACTSVWGTLPCPRGALIVAAHSPGARLGLGRR